MIDDVASVPMLLPKLRSHNPSIDMAFRIALGDLFGNVCLFRDGLLAQAQPCMLAGLDYDTPWTRDAAINVWNAGYLLPEISRDTLLCVLERGEGTAIGGQRWDALIWARGAWEHYLHSGNKAFLELALEAVARSLERAEAEEFDELRGLFRGASFFNDGVAGYPDRYAETVGHSSFILDWPAANPTRRSATGQGLPVFALSTNCIYFDAYRLATQMSRELDLAAGASWESRAEALRTSIVTHFWNAKTSRFEYLVDDWGGCDRQEGAGWSMAILFGVASDVQRAALFDAAHTDPAGMPCIYPTYERYRGDGADFGRHSGTVWPHVQALWAHASARYGRIDRFAHELFALARAACRDCEFAEIYHPLSTERYGGMQERNSPTPSRWDPCRRQTWSATGFIHMIVSGLFGVRFQPDGMSIEPIVPDGIGPMNLEGLRYRETTLSISVEGSGSVVADAILNGSVVDSVFIRGDHSGPHQVRIRMK